MNKIRTIDLFAGIGGIRKGFESTGLFETVYANDFDKWCKLTYDKNFDDAKLSLKDIRKVGVLNGDVPQFDFILSGFPCQPFSIGAHGKGFDDHKGRGTLFEEIIRLITESEQKFGQLPMGFMLENVKNLKSHDGGRTYQIIHDKLSALGYHIDSKVYNSLNFGVAQSRERIYIVGFRDKELLDNFKWPEPQVSPTDFVRVKDILEDHVDSRFYYNGKPLYDKIGHEVVNPDSVYTYRRNYVREQKQGYAPTLVASMGLGGHNVPIIRDTKGMRKLTPLECARVQGYYDLHIPLGVVDSQIYKQIGNSVSVPVIKAIAKEVAAAIDTLPVAVKEAVVDDISDNLQYGAPKLAVA
jgi:DNA (cytosine-5)-methyltransferase 1